MRIKHEVGRYAALEGEPRAAMVVPNAEWIEESIPRCWLAFSDIFSAAATLPAPDVNFLPRYVSRFAHFFQVYQILADPTENNAQRCRELLDILTAAVLKYACTVPSELIGRGYTAPKMAREIALAMKLKFGTSLEWKWIDHLLALSLDYLNAAEIDPGRQRLLARHFSESRRILDEAVEGAPWPIAHSIGHPELDTTLTELHLIQLIQSVAQSTVVNGFGRHSEPLFAERGSVHIALVIANEVLDGVIAVVATVDGRYIRHIKVKLSDLGVLLANAHQVARDTPEDSLQIWQAISAMLELDALLGVVKDVASPETQIHVYPDGLLWNLPWTYLVRSAAERTWETTPPRVAVRLGARPTTTARTSQHGVFLAGWEYGTPASPGLPARRGRTQPPLSDLPGARREAETLHANWSASGGTSTLCTDINADELLTTVSALNEATMLHLACHGITAADGMPTLWLPGDRREHPNTAMHYEKVLRVDWQHCEMVMINACFGGRGIPFAGGPALGIQEALSVSGARIVIAPLWPVDDEYAADFAVELYDRLAGKDDYLQAFTETVASDSFAGSEATATVAAYSLYLL
jgi:CHAT domain-containing protein